MPEAPGLVIERQRLAEIGGRFLGIVGNEDHLYGYHLERPGEGDDSLLGPANRPIGPYACAIDIGMDWAASREWLAWLIREIREDRITGIAEVIGSLDGVGARYWSDGSGWHERGDPYGGTGHVAWTHVAIYRSTALRDHGILAGWAADGYEGDTMALTDDDLTRIEATVTRSVTSGIRRGVWRDGYLDATLDDGYGGGPTLQSLSEQIAAMSLQQIDYQQLASALLDQIAARRDT